MIRFIVFVVFILHQVIGNTTKLPEEIPKCNKNDPNIDQCLKKAIQTAFPQIVSGMPEFGIAGLQPLKIAAMDILQVSGPVAVDLKIRNAKVYGLKGAIFTKVESDLDNYRIKFETIYKEPIIIDSDYDVKGRVLILPVIGKGKSRFIFEKVKCTHTVVGSELVKDGKKYMLIKKVGVKYDLEKLRMNFEGLLSQSKIFSNNINVFLNENWDELHKDVQPVIEKSLSAAYTDIASKLFSKVPFDEIFLP